MAVLSNPKHELFVQALARGKSATAAYKEAGYRGNGRTAVSNASRMLTNADIKDRLRELTGIKAAVAIEQELLSRADILRELAKVAIVPAGDEWVKASDKLTACMNYAKIEGWVIERKEVGDPGEFSAMDDEGLREYLRQSAIALGLVDVSETAH